LFKVIAFPEQTKIQTFCLSPDPSWYQVRRWGAPMRQGAKAVNGQNGKYGRRGACRYKFYNKNYKNFIKLNSIK